MATMAQKYGGLSGSFAVQLQQFSAKTQEKMDAIFQDIVIEIGESIIRMSPVDTGLFKGNWQFTVEVPASGTLDDPDKSGSEAIARLVRFANTLEAGQIAYIVNNLPYAIPLEYGHSKQAPSPPGIVRLQLARFQQIVSEAVRANQ